MAYKNALRQEYNVSINGGSDRSSFYASLGYLNEDGVIDNSGYDRVTARVKADYQAKKWLKIGANVGYIHSNRNSNPNMDTSLGASNLMYYTSMMPLSIQRMFVCWTNQVNRLSRQMNTVIKPTTMVLHSLTME